MIIKRRLFLQTLLIFMGFMLYGHPSFASVEMDEVAKEVCMNRGVMKFPSASRAEFDKYTHREICGKASDNSGNTYIWRDSSGFTCFRLNGNECAEFSADVKYKSGSTAYSIGPMGSYKMTNPAFCKKPCP